MRRFDEKNQNYYGDFKGDCEECAVVDCKLKKAYLDILCNFNDSMGDYDEEEEEYFEFSLKCTGFEPKKKEAKQEEWSESRWVRDPKDWG